MLDLKLIQHAIALAEHRHFARTAELLGISQPTLSRNIANLEASLGVRLFDRGQDGVAVTEFGKLLVSQGQAVVKSAADLEREIKLLQGMEVGELVVGVAPYPMEISMGRTLARMLTQYPGLRIEVVSLERQTLAQNVLAGNLDLIVVDVNYLEDEPRLQIERLPPHHGVFYCRGGHPLAGRHQPEFQEVFAFPYAGTRMPPRIAQALENIPNSGSIEKTTGDFLPPININSLRTCREIVLQSDAITIGIRSHIAEDVVAGRLAIVDFHPPWLVTNYGFIYARNRTLSPAALTFMEEMRAVEAEID